MQNKHEPVLLDEVVTYLDPKKFAHLYKTATFVDATVGFGGHSKEFVKQGVFVLGIDADTQALQVAEKVLKQACPPRQHSVAGCFKLVHGNFKDIEKIVKREDITKVYGVLMDLGVNSEQLTSQERGLSFQNPNALLDMRLDTNSSQVRANDLLNVLPEPELFKLFETVLEYPEAKKLAKAIREKREIKSFETVGDLLEVIEKGRTGSWGGKGKTQTHQATLQFMALRMAVNSELENLKEALPKAFLSLEKSGRLAVISFHSGEDRIVKDFMREEELEGLGRVETKKPVTPSATELAKNLRARSAKLRVIEKI